MKALEVYVGSDGAATKAMYVEMEQRGPIGLVAMNLFRAQKCSERAKKYRGGIPGKGSYRGMAYERKGWSMQQLCEVLVAHAEDLRMRWGWGEDRGSFVSWVLYLDLPQGQVSFHSNVRYAGPDYEGQWDGATGASPARIVQFCDCVLALPPRGGCA